MGCAFCEIVAGELWTHVVWESPDCVAFLDRRPVFVGHTLVVPKLHVETLTDLPDDLLAPLMRDARLLAGAIRRALDAHGTFVAINNTVSQSVPHLHVHVVPRRFKDGLRGFFWPRQRYEDDEHARRTAEAINKVAAELAHLEEGSLQ